MVESWLAEELVCDSSVGGRGVNICGCVFVAAGFILWAVNIYGQIGLGQYVCDVACLCCGMVRGLFHSGVYLMAVQGEGFVACWIGDCYLSIFVAVGLERLFCKGDGGDVVYRES